MFKDQQEQDLIIGQLTSTLSGVQIRPFLQAALPVDAMRQLREDLSLPGQFATEIVSICTRDRWNNSPPWLLLLLRVLPPTPDVEALKQRIAQPPQGRDPWNATLLITEMPFVDRGPTRAKLARLDTATGALKPILVVTGNPKSGKSWTRLFIEHLHLTQAIRFEYCSVRFLADQGGTCSPEALARDILVSFGVRIDSLPPSFFASSTNLELWPAELARKVLAEIRKDGTCRWIVLDGYAGSTLREDTRKFIKGLAEQITSSSIYAESFRLLLLGFDGQATTLAPGRVDPDPTQPITQTHVLACVQEIFALTNKPLEKPDEAETTAQRIMRDLPEGHQRMEELQLRLADVLLTARGVDV